jgi:hypothetical protein
MPIRRALVFVFATPGWVGGEADKGDDEDESQEHHGLKGTSTSPGLVRSFTEDSERESLCVQVE